MDKKSFGLLAHSVVINARQLHKFKESNLGSHDFEEAASYLLEQHKISKQIERVLVIPVKKHKNIWVAFQLIFGYGDVIQEAADLCIMWNSETEQFAYLPFTINIDRKEIASSLEIFKKLRVPKTVGVPPLDVDGRSKIYYAGVEEIKTTLERGRGFWSKHPFEVNKENPSKLLSQLEIKSFRHDSNLKYVNVILHRFKDSAFILLRDIYDSRYSIKPLGNNRLSLNYDPYSIVRGVLKYIKIYAERRSGTLKRTGRLSVEDKNAILDDLREKCKKLNISKPSKEHVYEAFKWQMCPKPKDSLVKKIIKEVQRKRF